MKKQLLVFILFFSFSFSTYTIYAQKFQNMAPVPPMGWNSWNRFGCNVNEKMLKETADMLVETGMRDAGYTYLVIDDCWHGERDSLGFVQEHPDLFPSGMKALAEYIHARGLKFGIYSSAGFKTCAGRPASRGREYQDAMVYASWDVDYLKYDWCGTEGLSAYGAYMTMRDALHEAGRPVVFSLCEWGSNKPWLWGAKMGHLWRTTGDICAIFDGLEDHGTYKTLGVLQILDLQDTLRTYAGPDGWNDPDMLQVGNGMTVGEDRAHFTMWCILSAPLMAGNDLRNMNPETIEILMNREAIAIDQDPLGIQGFPFKKEGSLHTWLKPLLEGRWAVCFLNRGTQDISLSIDWKQITVKDELSGQQLDTKKNVYSVRDIWAKEDLGTTGKKDLNALLPGHDVFCVVLTPVNAL
jgi:alpha-galactosidase